ncbi:AlpA family transcriptional regulator [Modicisalibacter xianhensis]|uniref:AlpA family transcriptional regulator n=1 Tax=Modicisalibacter xianhensis TaxID=442341 RepID=A0A4R8F8T4_9GAMM|nr:AlpA family transcriptional regulator [Halomonas xianhensis]
MNRYDIDSSQVRDDERIFSLQESAKFLGVSLTTLWRLHAVENVLDKPMRVSKRKKGFRKSTLEEYLKSERGE